MKKTTAEWFKEIADIVERWPQLPDQDKRDDPSVGWVTETPAGAMLYIAKKILDPGEKAAVLAALPTIGTNDFSEAARRIREAANRLP
jgi:hypothetical protein